MNMNLLFPYYLMSLSGLTAFSHDIVASAFDIRLIREMFAFHLGLAATSLDLLTRN